MADLTNMNRDDLNAHAAEQGFPAPEKFEGTKAELVEALEQFTADGTLPEGHPPAAEPAETIEGAADAVLDLAEASAEPAGEQLTQEVKAYLRNPSRVHPPAAVINFGSDRPIRPRKE